VVDRIQALGSDLVTISRGPPGVRGAERTVVSLLPGDGMAARRVEGVAAMTPEIDGVLVARHRNRDFIVTVSGVSDEFPQVRNWPVAAGGFFDAEHVQRYSQVAVLGATAAANLFPDRDPPIGEYVLIGNVPFRVIGVMVRKGVTTGPGHDRDNQIWLPHTTASARLFGRAYVDRIVVKTELGADADAVAAELRATMLARHKLEDFSVNTIAEVIRTAARTQRTFDYLLAAIAAISLVVGGIGVMNIMLSSVNARTREIGIRMTVGAARRDVLTQFLVEALVICVVGGLAGILLGIFTGWATAAISGIIVLPTAGPIVLALVSAVLTGLVFGLLPARRAAELDPIEAFRRS
jgi:macrolide transport system ATP-binding/permease protein